MAQHEGQSLTNPSRNCPVTGDEGVVETAITITKQTLIQINYSQMYFSATAVTTLKHTLCVCTSKAMSILHIKITLKYAQPLLNCKSLPMALFDVPHAICNR